MTYDLTDDGTGKMCDACKDDIDGTRECPYEDYCFYKCYSAYNKILQKKSARC